MRSVAANLSPPPTIAHQGSLRSEGVFFISLFVQRSVQRHLYVLGKKTLTEQFVVEDLCGEGGCRSVSDVLRAGDEPKEPEAPDMERGALAEPLGRRATSAGGRPVLDASAAQQARRAMQR